MIAYNTLIVLGGVSLLGLATGVVGAFAVLRRRALTGDALAHAALPGLCVAFMLTGERRLSVLLLGALGSGLLGNLVIASLRRWTRLKEDAVIGIVGSVFIGLGFVLSRLIQNLPGGSKAGIDSFLLGKTAGMTRGDLELIAVVAGVCVALVAVMYKELKLASFDPEFARSLGRPVYWFDLLLMTCVAVAVVIGLPAVGVVLVASLLILPGAAARMWTDSLAILLVIAGALGFGVGIVGTLFSATLSLFPAGPIIILSGTVAFIVSLVFGSRRGLLAGWVRQRSFQRTWEERQLLAWVHDAAATTFRVEDIATEKIWSTTRATEIIDRVCQQGWGTRRSRDVVELTPAGRERARDVVRGRRLWALFLTEHPDLATSVADLSHESVTECLPPDMVKELTALLKDRGEWPE